MAVSPRADFCAGELFGGSDCVTGKVGVARGLGFTDSCEARDVAGVCG